MSVNEALVNSGGGSNLLFSKENDRDFLARLHVGQQSVFNTICLTRSLLALIARIQRHRGASMALLGGDHRFAEGMTQLQKEIGLRIEFLMLESVSVINEVDKENIRSAWKTIAHNWQDDAVLENFEYHSHLIEYLLRIVRTKGDDIVAGFSVLTVMMTPPNGYIKDIAILNCLACSTIPDCFELLAKLRGLATHAAASHRCDSVVRGRIEFSLKELMRLTAKLDLQIRDLNSDMKDKLMPGNELAQTKVKRDYLCQLLGNDIVEGSNISLDSEMVYRVSTDVIDAYYLFSESILAYFETRWPLMLETCFSYLSE